MQQIFSNTTLTVNQLIEKIDTGELGLPELQRPFIWKDSKVRDLFDSMMCGYPIGYLMLWECPTLEKKKTIGTDSHNYESPKQVIIDGQQRLTSLYAVMKGKKVINSKYDEKAIVISYCPLKNKFEVGYQATKKDPEWIYNISEVFTTANITKLIINFTKKLAEYRTSKGEALSDEEQDLISENITALSNLKQHTLPVFDIKANAEEEDVSEIFVRVNSGGVALKQNDFILTLLSLYWDEGRKEIEQFSMESTYPSKDKITSYNQLTEITAQDVIRVVMAYAFDRARLKYGYKLLRGADFDKKGAVDETLRNQRFDALKSKLPDVLNVHNWHEFLKSIMNAGYLSGDLILSGNAIYYTYAFYLIAKYRFNASYNENMHLTSLWFFYASLVSLYTGSFESTVENHLNSIKELTSLKEYKRFILSRVEERLTNDYFDITLIGSEGLAVSGRGNNAWNAYVAALNILNAKILFSKSNLLVSKLFEPGTDGKRKSLEKHHLFPKAYLKTLGYNDAKINQMANYAFIDWKDNMEILDEAPSIYYPVVCESRSPEEIQRMEEENALPHGWENMSYEDFLIERRKLMAAKIKAAIEQLKKNVERSRMKIGRNDPCPCGSGKKYKHCCLLKESMSTGDLIRAAVQNAGYKEDIANVLCNLSEYMKRKQWWGACHASCSALYVAFSELGYSPKLCIGEMLGQGLYFDHSWIELDGQILDIAISMTLLGGAPVSEPIVFGKNIRSGKEPVIKYGVPGRGIEGETLVVNSLPFIDYMDGFPDEKNGLWGVVQELLGRKVDIPDLREKYKDVERVIVREEAEQHTL